MGRISGFWADPVLGAFHPADDLWECPLWVDCVEKLLLEAVLSS
jgi:hypothetical protein